MIHTLETLLLILAGSLLGVGSALFLIHMEKSTWRLFWGRQLTSWDGRRTPPLAGTPK